MHYRKLWHSEEGWARQASGTSVPGARSANRAQESDEMSSSPHDPVGPNVEDSMFVCFAQKLVDRFMPTSAIVDKRFSIERMKVLGATIFKETTNLAAVEKWLIDRKNILGWWSALKKKEWS